MQLVVKVLDQSGGMLTDNIDAMHIHRVLEYYVEWIVLRYNQVYPA